MPNLPSLKPASRPSELIPETDRDQWFLNWGKYIVHQWWQGECLVDYNGGTAFGEENISVLRAYGRGQQGSRKYRQILDKEIKSKEGITQSLMNISWRVPQIFPTMRERIIDRVLERRMDPSVIAIDDASIERRNLAYLRDKIAVSPAGKSVMQATGMAPSNISDTAAIMNDQDVDILKALGGYTLAAEVALTEAIAASIDISGLFPTVQRQVIEDLVDLGVAHLHIVSNPLTKTQDIEYVDPSMAIIPKSQYDDSRDATWGGIVRTMSISALREEIRKHNGSVNEEDMMKIVKHYRSTPDNIPILNSMGSANYNARSNHGGGYNYDPMQVLVATCYMVAAEAETFIAGIHPSGSRVFKKVPPTTKLKKESERNGFRLERNTRQNVYKVNYVIGTDYMYGAGEDDMVARNGLPGAMQALIPIVSYRTNRKSLTESCISDIDDLCLSIFKKRNIIAKMVPPPGIQVNLSALENATQLGSLKLDPADLIEVMTISGILFTSDSEHTEFNQGTPQNPVSPLPNTTFDQLRTIQLDIETSLNSLRATTGTNEISDGSANPTNVLTTTVNAYQSSSNRALSFLYTANESMQSTLHLHLGRRYQSIAASGGATLRWVPVRTDTVRIVQLTPDIAFGEYTVISKPNVSKDMQQYLLSSVQTYKNANSLDAADEYAVVNMIMRGEYKKAQYYLASSVNRKKQQDIAVAQENARAQAEAQGQAGVAVEQARQQTVALQGEVDANTLKLKHSLGIETLEKESELGLGKFQQQQR